MTVIALTPMISVSTVVQLETAFGNDIIQMVVHAGLMVKLVLLILFLLSVVSWMIIFVKWRVFHKARQDNAYFLELYWENTEFSKIYEECDDLIFSPLARLFKSGYTELKKISKIHAGSTSKDQNQTIQPVMNSLERSLRKTAIDETSRAEKTLSFLATTGNTAPFIGLFGTVWGIMESFRNIGMKGSASLAVVAPGISEALIATAAGLAAAIPAVVAFNYFNRKVVALTSEMDSFTSDFLALLERHFIKKQMTSKEG